MRRKIFLAVTLSLALGCAGQLATQEGDHSSPHDESQTGIDDSTVSSSSPPPGVTIDDVMSERQQEMMKKMMRQTRPTLFGPTPLRR